jgi:hypothetical protein
MMHTPLTPLLDFIFYFVLTIGALAAIYMLIVALAAYLVTVMQED